MSEKNFKVLHLEDDTGHAKLIRALLNDARFTHFEVTPAQTLREALDLLKKNEFDIILCDLGLSDSHGLPTLHKLMTVASHLPIVALTGTFDSSLGIDAMQVGAEDYLIKDQVNAEARPSE